MPKPRHLEPGKTEGVEVVVAQGLLDRAVGARHRTDNGLLKARPPTEGGAPKAHPGVEVYSVESRRAIKGRKFKTCLSTENYTAGEAGILPEAGFGGLWRPNRTMDAERRAVGLQWM
jgi:hypothetical protein